MSKLVFLIGFLFLLLHPVMGQRFHPDSTQQVLNWIKQKNAYLDTLSIPQIEDLQTAVALGRNQLYLDWLEKELVDGPVSKFHLLEFLFREHNYADISSYLFGATGGHSLPKREEIAGYDLFNKKYDLDIKMYAAQISITLWNLDAAKSIYLDLLDDSTTKTEALIGLGNMEILQKNYLKAEALAMQVLESDSTHAEAYKLAAEANFWKRDEAKAEAFIKKSIYYNPLDANARFAYGYAIWRRRDATLLNEMAAQWEIALKLNPYHYKTHWHWGNGHTHLTYQDYFDPNEKQIRNKLDAAEELIVKGQFAEGVSIIRQQKTAYPNSVIPDMYLGSFFYQRADSFSSYLDSAEQVFFQILRQKAHYGPAHNGLAAVIKKRQMEALADYVTLEEKIEHTQIPENKHFEAVFPDVKRYPGERVAKMIWEQLKTTTAYLPMLDKVGRTFAIPPLHEDLALAMKNSYFRGGTTFDNRQWMDIRGVGSGATGIEYVERGAHLERNVTLHEYVHLFHGLLFTDAEMREVRSLYYQAMEEGRVLDYYAANNEFEYLAQIIPAYFSEKKVHPLNHKAANTRADLLEKDPEAFSWVEKLVKKQQAALQGDSTALAGNWAQAYLALSDKVLIGRNDSLASRYVDTARIWYPDYVPAIIKQSRLARRKGDLKKARRILAKQMALAPQNAALLAEEAGIWSELYTTGQASLDKAIRKASQGYAAAMEYEDDLMLKAELNGKARSFFRNFGLWEEGISLAEAYILDASEVSTYLRDEKDANRLYIASLKGKMGHYLDAKRSFKQLIKAKPQNYYYRAQYGEVLLQLGKYSELVELIKPSQELLKAAGAPRRNFQQLLALAYLGQDDSLSFVMTMAEMRRMPKGRRGNPWLDLQLKTHVLGADSALSILENRPVPKEPLQASAYYYQKACLLLELDRMAESESFFKHALKALPYHFQARMSYIQLLEKMDRKKEAEVVAREGLYLPFPPGDHYASHLEQFLENEE